LPATDAPCYDGAYERLRKDPELLASLVAAQ
jgi:hypothetical protein